MTVRVCCRSCPRRWCAPGSTATATRSRWRPTRPAAASTVRWSGSARRPGQHSTTPPAGRVPADPSAARRRRGRHVGAPLGPPRRLCQAGRSRGRVRARGADGAPAGRRADRRRRRRPRGSADRVAAAARLAGGRARARRRPGAVGERGRGVGRGRPRPGRAVPGSPPAGRPRPGFRRPGDTDPARAGLPRRVRGRGGTTARGRARPGGA